MHISYDIKKFKKVDSSKLHISEVNSDLTINNLYFEKAGKPILPVVGEFHFGRYARREWDTEIKKMKVGGVVVVSTYLMWIFHEEEEGKFNFEGDYDLRYFLEVCEKNNMYVILRIGPWVHAEIVYGGFPKWIQDRKDKRSSSPEYLEKVRILYRAYYNESKEFFYQNGSILVGIQLENEYGGNDKKYIPALRRIAMEEGFLLPLYTITAWPHKGHLKGDLLPTFGRYLARPWTQNIDPLPIDNRYKICTERIDQEIGSDLLRRLKAVKTKCYYDFPYATCEVGLAIQPYEHRRPVMTGLDAFSAGVIQIAQGVNMLGYYVYHGGRNPLGRYQESRATGYPNDVPILSYDYETAIGEYGYPKESYHRLKLLHYLLLDDEANMAVAQQFFVKKAKGEIAYKTAIRMTEEGRGYLFINNHRKYPRFEPIENLYIDIKMPDGNMFVIPDINMPSGKAAIYPINMKYGPLEVDYATIEPICHSEGNGVKRYYFFATDGVTPRVKLKDQRELVVEPNDGEIAIHIEEIDGIRYEYYVLDETSALKLYKVDGKVFMSEDTVINIDDNGYYADHMSELEYSKRVSLESVEHIKKADEDYLFSHSEPSEYKLNVPANILDEVDDVRIDFTFEGNVLQLYCNGVLKADWFNYDGKWTIGLKRFKEEIEHGENFRIVISPIDSDHPIYLEYPLKKDTVEISILEQRAIKKEYYRF